MHQGSARRRAALVVFVLFLAGSADLRARQPVDPPPERPPVPPSRVELFEALQPVPIADCGLQRFGEPHDGGYLLCGQLLGDVEAGYSYGISGYDAWGCDVSRRLGVTVHQYDCFDRRRPACPVGRTVFHAECVGADPDAPDGTTSNGHLFRTLDQQVAANGDRGRSLVVKMDIEGGEWDSLPAASDELLARIDQLVVEFHEVDEPRFVEVIRRLKEHFHVAHLHFNNFSCKPDLAPFPAWAYEVLFVNRRIARLDPQAEVSLPHPQDALNAPRQPDCQTVAEPPTGAPPRAASRAAGRVGALLVHCTDEIDTASPALDADLSVEQGGLRASLPARRRPRSARALDARARKMPDLSSSRALTSTPMTHRLGTDPPGTVH